MDLAATFKEKRKARGLTLRAVEKVTGIEFSRLRKIEQSCINPSACIVWQLCTLYGMDLKQTLIDAGIIIKK